MVEAFYLVLGACLAVVIEALKKSGLSVIKKKRVKIWTPLVAGVLFGATLGPIVVENHTHVEGVMYGLLAGAFSSSCYQVLKDTFSQEAEDEV